jgi:predicted RNase H-like HicB family nuclease
MTAYIAILRKDPDSDFGVDFPDFPGCITAGSTLDEARVMAVEALTGHIRGMLEDGEPIPEPSALEAVMADPDNRDGVAVLIDVPVHSKSIRVNVMLPEDLLRQIDQVTKNRSRFLAEAAKSKLLAA